MTDPTEAEIQADLHRAASGHASDIEECLARALVIEREKVKELKGALDEDGLPIYPLEAVSFLKSHWKNAFLDGLNIQAWRLRAEQAKADAAHGRRILMETTSQWSVAQKFYEQMQSENSTLKADRDRLAGELADLKAACESGKCLDLIEARVRELEAELAKERLARAHWADIAHDNQIGWKKALATCSDCPIRLEADRNVDYAKGRAKQAGAERDALEKKIQETLEWLDTSHDTPFWEKYTRAQLIELICGAREALALGGQEAGK